MLLLCRTGLYRQVVKRLLYLGISYIYLLFGPMDILCKFEFSDLEELKEKWFNKVRIMGGKEEWITQSMTFFVINSCGEITEQPFAFIFLNMHPRNLETVQRSLLELSQIMTVDTVFGPYDIICSVKANNIEELEKVIDHIQRTITQIKGSVTAIVAEKKNQFL